MAGVTVLEPAASGVTGRKEMRNSLNLAHPKDNIGQKRDTLRRPNRAIPSHFHWVADSQDILFEAVEFLLFEG